MEYYGSPITRKIWGSIENLILIYIGSSADFALNPENFWLFFTNSLPSNPQKRFIETFRYNQRIFFTPMDKIPELMERIRSIHNNVEKNREHSTGDSTKISNNAFKQVGDMLIDYGIKGYEYLHHTKMMDEDKESYYQDMVKLFQMMGVRDYENNYPDFVERRTLSIQNELQVNEFTDKLYDSYYKDIGWWKLWILKQFQVRFVSSVISSKLNLKKNILFSPLYLIYPYIRNQPLLDLEEILFMNKDTVKVIDQMEAELKTYN